MNKYEEIRLPWQEWKIVKDLGGGAYGRVYEIERNVSGIREKAALKIVSRPKDANEVEAYYSSGYDKANIAESYRQEIRNYVQEYKIMKELQGQSNIVSCDDFTVVPHEDGIGGDIFIRMELLTSLQQVLKEKMLSVEEIIKLGKDISRALILCESKHIVHRDIKPANIMVSQFGDYKLGDFGVSKIMDHVTFATAMGTPEYQAPEVVHMERYGHRADIYSLGVTLYWLLNNRKMPFIDADKKLDPMMNEEATRKRYQGEELPVPKNGSAGLKKIVLKACEYRPENRYASAQELYDALEALENEKAVTGSNVRISKVSANSVSKGNGWSADGQTQGNSWGETGETIGKPGGKKVQNEWNKGNPKETQTETVGVKDAYAKQKKAEKKKEVVAEERGKKKENGMSFFVMVYGVASIFLFLGAFIGSMDNVMRFHSVYRNSNQEFLYGKGLYEVSVSVFVWLGLILAIAFVKMWNASKNIRIIGPVLQVHAIITAIAIPFEEIYLHMLGKELDTSGIISTVIVGAISIYFFGGVAYLIRALLKEQKK